ncbi:monovalent cation/H(+) antiporter subunit G [Ferruginivarius sediminum]|uniref:Monovalent cation/H(+) antiporter subunit G n=1 Tax=Ferruginivarius sediminum TaxID=2661937 RepID=A0A369TF32_9PROT|nr:monovalent cation/H(+) antiporter subunit G [Ferruginivarius sediminum]RDD63878.1 monovalent cation/H(+) antiporter subunit G [Ferruginivarius sediminum]
MVATFFDILAGVAVLIGAFFVLVAAVGVVRMPDVYVRMHAATKSGTLGSGLMLIGVAIQSGEVDIIMRALAAVVFLIATTPVAAHLLGRAAYICGVPPWRGTWIDELKGHYDPETHYLSAGNEPVNGGENRSKTKQ